jgi:putative FmdB family regulatory protein
MRARRGSPHAHGRCVGAIWPGQCASRGADFESRAVGSRLARPNSRVLRVAGCDGTERGQALEATSWARPATNVVSVWWHCRHHRVAGSCRLCHDARAVPTYDYQCRSCGTVTEVIHSMLVDGPSICEKCGGDLRRVLYPTGIIFKGSGFYSTDSREARSNSSSSSAPAAKKESGSGDASPSASTSAAGESSSSTSSSPSPTPSKDAASD